MLTVYKTRAVTRHRHVRVLNRFLHQILRINLAFAPEDVIS